MAASPLDPESGPAGADARSNGGERLYTRIMRVLQNEIAGGRYQVGSRLPTEQELCLRFAASRNSVREALRHLRDAGLVSPRQGSGTLVVRAEPAGEFVHSVPIIEEIDWTRASQFRLDRCTMVRADARLARRLNCSPGRQWLWVEGYRFADKGAAPLCWNEVYLHPVYAGISDRIGRQPGPIYALVEEAYGERVVEVRETVRPLAVAPELAAALQIEPHAMALAIERTYKAANDRVVEVAFSIHPVDRFTYSITLRRGAT